MDLRTLFKRLSSKIIIPFLIVLLSGILLLHILEISSPLLRPFIVVYYGVFIGSFLTIYFWIVDD